MLRRVALVRTDVSESSTNPNPLPYNPRNEPMVRDSICRSSEDHIITEPQPVSAQQAEERCAHKSSEVRLRGNLSPILFGITNVKWLMKSRWNTMTL
jgi:hypothetical protein